MSIYEKKFCIDYFDIGEGNEFLNLGFLKLMQKVAGMHSKEIEKTFGKIKKENIGWVITDWKLKVEERPEENDEVLIRTWIRKINKLYFYRDFEVFNEQGKCIAKAESKWIWMNLEDRSIVKVDDEARKKYEEVIENKEVFDDNKLKKIDTNQEYTIENEYTVCRRDIDLNHHVNNLNYLVFANEAIPENIYAKGEVNNIEIIYKKELKIGDVIECLYKEENEDEYEVLIQNKISKEVNAIIKFIR